MVQSCNRSTGCTFLGSNYWSRNGKNGIAFLTGRSGGEGAWWNSLPHRQRGWLRCIDTEMWKKGWGEQIRSADSSTASTFLSPLSLGHTPDGVPVLSHLIAYSTFPMGGNCYSTMVISIQINTGCNCVATYVRSYSCLSCCFLFYREQIREQGGGGGGNI